MFTRHKRTIVVSLLLCFACCYLMAAGSNGLSPRSMVGTSGVVALMVAGDDDDDCRSDSNNDEVVDILDFLWLLRDWGPCEDDRGDDDCRSDTNDDDVVDILDFLNVLDDWGPCEDD